MKSSQQYKRRHADVHSTYTIIVEPWPNIYRVNFANRRAEIIVPDGLDGANNELGPGNHYSSINVDMLMLAGFLHLLWSRDLTYSVHAVSRRAEIAPDGLEGTNDKDENL